MNNNNKNVQLTAPVGGDVEASVKNPIITIRESATLSMNQYCSAAFFARKAREIEEEYTKSTEKTLSDQQKYEHTAYVIGSIFAARAYLEATINQVFLDAIEPAPNSITAPLKPFTSRMATAWKLKSGFDFSKFDNVFLVNRGNKGKEVEKWGPAEDKFQCALVLACQKPFDREEEELRSICVLRYLRNDLVHHTPGWITYQIGGGYFSGPNNGLKKYEHANNLVDQLTKYATKCGRDLNSIKNPLLPVGSSFYPNTYLGSTCAEWAVRSSKAFTDEFFLRMGKLDWAMLMDHRYKKVCKSLNLI
jgi:hypothetical protein